MHRQAQFDRIATPANDRIHASALPDIDPPEKGDLPPDQLATLCQILRPHTPDSIACWFAVWDGWGDLTGSTSTAFAYYGFGEPPAPPPPAPRHWQLDLGAARFDLPHRRYYLFTGELDDALRIGHWHTRTWFEPRSPNLFWPDTGGWCVASEIDFDSTLVAGSAALIEEILGNDELEAWLVEPHDSMSADGDTVNRP